MLKKSLIGVAIGVGCLAVTAGVLVVVTLRELDGLLDFTIDNREYSGMME